MNISKTVNLSKNKVKNLRYKLEKKKNIKHRKFIIKNTNILLMLTALLLLIIQ